MQVPSDVTDPALVLRFRNDLRACTRCDLRKTATAPVPFSGELNPDILIIAEAPGLTEDREGEPLIGTAGNMLKTLLRESGLWKVATFAYTNACQCFPNRGLSPTADAEYIDTCRSWMRGQVAIIQPRYVISTGQVPFRSIRGDRKVPTLAQLHGKPVYWADAPPPAHPTAMMFTYHPSAALRSTKYKRTILEDFIAFRKWVDDGEIWPETCWCGDELYRFDPDGWGIGLCRRHAQFQSSPFPDDLPATLSPSIP